MIKVQQQVSANQGRLDIFVGTSKSGAAAAAAATIQQPNTHQAKSSSSLSHRDAHLPAPSKAAYPPTDITNLPAVLVNKADARAQPVPQQAKQAVLHTGSQQTGQAVSKLSSPGKQAKMQSFFQPRQHIQAGAPQGSRPTPSWVKQRPVDQQHMSSQPRAPVAMQQQQQGQQQQRQQQQQLQQQVQGQQPQQQGQQQEQQWQQQERQQQERQQHERQQQERQQQQHSANLQATKASGVFAADDDDMLWPQDDVFLSHHTAAASAAQPGLGQSSVQAELVDQTAPLYKKARTSG